MERMRLVPLLRADDAFHGRVVAARLGADGIVTQVRGDDTLYPGGQVEILVTEHDLPIARELLLADEVEAVFLDEHGPDGAVPLGRWTIALVLIGLAIFAWFHTVGFMR